MVAKSIQLISQDKNSNLVLNPEGLEQLKAIKQELGVCVVVGPYRQGKSYFLSKLIGSTANGFKVGHTDQSCTKGIYMWSEPIPVETDTGIKYLILLDTEGLESDDSNEEWDNKLFLVSILISSMFIYNTKNALTSDALKKLSAVASFSQKVKLNSKTKSSNRDKTDIRNSFCPTFTWIVRDFSLKTTMTAREKLERFLEHEVYIEDSSLSVKENEKRKANIKIRNEVREQLADAFKSLYCFYMPVPVADGIDGLSFEEALERLHLLPASKLRPQFENAFNKVVEHLQNSFELKMINNNKMNGPILVEYMKNIVESINKNEQIFLMDTLNSSLKFIASESLKKAEHEYELEMNEYTLSGAEAKKWEDFYTFEKLAYNNGIELLNEEIFSEELLNETKKNFVTTIRTSDRPGTFKYYVQLNKIANAKQNKEIISNEWNERIADRVKRAIEEFETSNELSEEISKVKSDIEKELPNCNDFEELWQSFLVEIKISKVLNDLDSSNRKRAELKKELEAKEKILAEKTRSLQKEHEEKQRFLEEEARRMHEREKAFEEQQMKLRQVYEAEQISLRKIEELRVQEEIYRMKQEQQRVQEYNNRLPLNTRAGPNFNHSQSFSSNTKCQEKVREVFVSRGCANDREVFTGPKGGKYYLDALGQKQRINGDRLKCVKKEKN